MSLEQQSDTQKTRQLAHISDASLIEEGGYSQLVNRAILFIAGMLLVFIVWATFTKLDEVAISFGEVQPMQDVQPMQHVQGGTIAIVYVKNGEEVKAGSPLIKLNPEQVRAELMKAQSREVSLLLDAERLHAFINKTPVQEVNWRKAIKATNYDTQQNSKNIDNSIRENTSLLSQQNKERESQYLIYHEKVEQKKAQLRQYADSKADLERKLSLHKDEEKMYRSLVEKGYASKLDLNVSQRKTIEAIAQLKQTEAKIDEARGGLEEAENELKRLNTTFTKKALEDLNEINSQLLDVHHTIQRLKDLSDNLIIKAPITGIVKGLNALPGSVISPAEVIMDIVPTKGEMIVNCKISTRDIGHVHLDDPAQVKIMAYEFTRYGTVPGKVMEISADTFANQDGLPYYKGKILLEKNYVGDNPAINQLKPGMTAQVDILTGKKTIISYLIKPITRGLSTSFKER